LLFLKKKIQKESISWENSKYTLMSKAYEQKVIPAKISFLIDDIIGVRAFLKALSKILTKKFLRRLLLRSV